MQIQFRALEVFLTVVEKNSFTKAAETLYVGQPALSKTVQKLEEELNVKLFDRSSKKLQLTDEGKVLYQKSKDIIQKVNSIPDSLNEVSDVISGEVRVGIPQIIGTVFFPKIAYTFLQKFPKVTLLTEESGGVIIEKLVNKGELDIGLVVLPVSKNTLQSELFYQDEFVVCISEEHPMANLKEIYLGDLKDEKFILFDKSFALYNLIYNHCINSGFSPKVNFQSKQWDLVLELVSARLGITIVPKTLTNKLNDINIVSIPLKHPKILWNIGIITKKNAYQSYALKEFIKVIKNIYK